MSEPEAGIALDPGRVVSNSGPLITLAAVGKLDLLKGLFSRVHIPEAVYDEVVVRGKGEPGACEVDAAEWIEGIFSIFGGESGADFPVCRLDRLESLPHIPFPQLIEKIRCEGTGKQ